MEVVAIAVGGRRYRIQCGPGEAARVTELARAVDERAAALSGRLGHLEESTLLMMTCLTLADELDQARGEATRERAAADGAVAAAHDATAARLEAAASRLTQLVERIARAV